MDSIESYLDSEGAALHVGLSQTYLENLRTRDAHKRGLSGPPHIEKFGRILYHIPALDTWNQARLAKKV